MACLDEIQCFPHIRQGYVLKPLINAEHLLIRDEPLKTPHSFFKYQNTSLIESTTYEAERCGGLRKVTWEVTGPCIIHPRQMSIER